MRKEIRFDGFDISSPFDTFDGSLIANRSTAGEKHNGTTGSGGGNGESPVTRGGVAAKPGNQRFKSVRRRGVTRRTAAITE